MSHSDLRYDERLHVPWLWWVLPALWLTTLWVAFAFAAGAALAWAVTAALGAACFGVLAAYGSARVQVGATELRAGGSALDLDRVGEVAVLDPEQARRVRGQDADARAHLFLRAYARGAVAVEVSRDPDGRQGCPYWYVSTRHPQRLASALVAGRSVRPGTGERS